MKCTTCGYETQPGAKFCVQCGTTIVAASPAGMAPLAAPSVTPRPAAAPPASSTSATAARPAYTPSPASATAARPAYTPPPTSAPDPAVVSAVPASSMRLGLIAGLLALIAVIGIGSFIAYKMMSSAPPKEPVTAAETLKPAASAPAQPAADASKDSAAPANAAGGAPMNNMSTQPTPASTPSADSAAATAAASPDASKAAAGAAVPKSVAASAQTKAGTPAKADAPTTGAPVAAPAASPSRQAAAPAPAVHPAPAAQADRWELMRQAYEVCGRESLFDRLACNQRVGQQYCKGYWGTVPQCPAGAYGDRANN